MRLLGITIPENKRLEIGLTAVYGIGRVRAHKILDETNINQEQLITLAMLVGTDFNNGGIKGIPDEFDRVFKFIRTIKST